MRERSDAITERRPRACNWALDQRPKSTSSGRCRTRPHAAQLGGFGHSPFARRTMGF